VIVKAHESAILLLEPEQSIQKLVKAILAPDKFTLVCVRDGEEALQVLNRYRFAAFIIDLSLWPSRLEEGSPGGSGFLHYLERTSPSALRRVVVVSALAKLHMPADIPPVCRFLSKPFSIDELREAIAECCSAGELSATTS